MESKNPYEHTDGYWLGRLSMGLAIATKDPRDPRARDALEAFIESQHPTEQLRGMLREELKK